tara:strand:+ start:45 stop:242 length:198 start_codon:yes stop_codon:yes gene_type:complete
MYWEIEPYHTNEADICQLPAETEEDHRKAIDYAQARLFELWDRLEEGQEATVKIRLVKGVIKEVE